MAARNVQRQTLVQASADCEAVACRRRTVKRDLVCWRALCAPFLAQTKRRAKGRLLDTWQKLPAAQSSSVRHLKGGRGEVVRMCYTNMCFDIGKQADALNRYCQIEGYAGQGGMQNLDTSVGEMHLNNKMK